MNGLRGRLLLGRGSRAFDRRRLSDAHTTASPSVLGSVARVANASWLEFGLLADLVTALPAPWPVGRTLPAQITRIWSGRHPGSAGPPPSHQASVGRLFTPIEHTGIAGLLVSRSGRPYDPPKPMPIRFWRLYQRLVAPGQSVLHIESA